MSPLTIFKTNSYRTHWLTLVCTLYLIWVYIAHGSQALLMAEKYHAIPAYLKLPVWTLCLVGGVDLLVALLLFLKYRTAVVLYAALWPFVPVTLNYLVTGELEIGGKLLIVGCALIILFMNRRNNGDLQGSTPLTSTPTAKKS